MNEMNDLQRKKRLIVTALGAQQIYAQCHDECVDLKFFKHDMKMHSKNLISKLERELMPIFGVLGNVDGGESYLKATELMEVTLQNLAVLPVEYWELINNAILDLQRQIDEKNQAGSDGVHSGSDTNVQPTGETSVDGDHSEEPADTKKHEGAGNRKSAKKVQK
jgi:hypothetical protein